ncbi:hypothetical protein POVWA2_033120 [Plasmodium ovale wallikeri]|uniref:Merozoite surface protein 3 n=2 Tax=Plasmodium ovale TaxID=36330 RepID=A0A1A8YYT5_PLAOA|nr:hypothetical protein POVWA1_033500 [Plasmodium ovale wallikeri]SBT37099.1 hypothetical protein POVWA2_033120 [Plasmodium ovale wallikeri]SBT72263.1 hypothetical protein, conserved [Plasmodium ovale]
MGPSLKFTFYILFLTLYIYIHNAKVIDYVQHVDTKIQKKRFLGKESSVKDTSAKEGQKITQTQNLSQDDVGLGITVHPSKVLQSANDISDSSTKEKAVEFADERLSSSPVASSKPDMDKLQLKRVIDTQSKGSTQTNVPNSEEAILPNTYNTTHGVDTTDGVSRGGNGEPVLEEKLQEKYSKTNAESLSWDKKKLSSNEQESIDSKEKGVKGEKLPHMDSKKETESAAESTTESEAESTTARGEFKKLGAHAKGDISLHGMEAEVAIKEKQKQPSGVNPGTGKSEQMMDDADYADDDDEEGEDNEEDDYEEEEEEEEEQGGEGEEGEEEEEEEEDEEEDYDDGEEEDEEVEKVVEKTVGNTIGNEMHKKNVEINAPETVNIQIKKESPPQQDSGVPEKIAKTETQNTLQTGDASSGNIDDITNNGKIGEYGKGEQVQDEDKKKELVLEMDKEETYEGEEQDDDDEEASPEEEEHNNDLLNNPEASEALFRNFEQNNKFKKSAEDSLKSFISLIEEDNAIVDALADLTHDMINLFMHF